MKTTVSIINHGPEPVTVNQDGGHDPLTLGVSERLDFECDSVALAGVKPVPPEKQTEAPVEKTA